MSNQPVKPPDPEVDFVNLANTIWKRKILVVKLTLIAAVGGFLVSLLIPNRYTASTMLFQELTDPSKIHSLGWHHKIEIDEGIEKLYHWYLES